MEIGSGKGVVGVFGAYTELIVHIGFFFDRIRDLNWKRLRECFLIKMKGEEPEDEEGKKIWILTRLDPYLFRYFARFI